MKKVLVIGSTGMLGHVVKKYLIDKKYDGNIYTNSNEHEFTLIMILPLKKF